MHHRIHDDEGSEQPLVFNRASQNVAAAAMLVRAMPEPSTTEGRRVRGELRDLLETAAVQQAESSASRWRGGASNLLTAPPRQDREAPARPDPDRAPIAHRVPMLLDRLGNRREVQGDHEVVSRRRRHDNEGPARGYHPHRGGRYDSEEDRSPSPEPPGPRVFSRAIRAALFPARLRQPANLVKYNGETNPELWLANYRLAY